MRPFSPPSEASTDSESSSSSSSSPIASLSRKSSIASDGWGQYEKFEGDEEYFTDPLGSATESEPFTAQKAIEEAQNDVILITERRGDPKGLRVVDEWVSPVSTDSPRAFMSFSIPVIRVVEHTATVPRYAQFLVVFTTEDHRKGRWMRYTEIATMVAEMDLRRSHLSHASVNWDILTRNMRWMRCLDKAYLTLKGHLIENFFVKLGEAVDDLPTFVNYLYG